MAARQVEMVVTARAQVARRISPEARRHQTVETAAMVALETAAMVAVASVAAIRRV
jgi:hypothetical protein